MEPSALHILIVDDSPEDRLIVRRYLARTDSSAYRVTEASRGEEALAACEAALPDCILLDYRLPDSDGLEALAALRARSDVPVVVLTGVGSETVAVEALRRGAQDYLVKGDLSPERLSLTIQHAVSTVRLTRERDQMQTLLSTLLEALPVGVAVLDPDLCIRHANPALTGFLGQTSAALPGQVLSQRWPALMDDLAAPCAQLQRGERFSDLELCLPEPSGADGRWLSFGGIPLRIADGAGSLALLTVQDITARRQAEIARSTHEARFRALIENGTEGVILLDADLQPSYVSPTITPILGYAPETFATLGASGLCHPDDQPQLEAFITTLTAQPGATTQVTIRLRHQDDTWRWIEQRGQNQTRMSALASIIISLHDVTARVLAEQATQTAAERLNILAAASHAFAEVVTDELALLDRVARLTAEPLVASCTIWRSSADALSLHLGAVYDRNPAVQAILNAGFLGTLLPADSPHPAAAVARSGHPLHIPIIDPETIRAMIAPELWATFEHIRPRSTIIVPLRARGTTLGSLVFSRHEQGQPAFTADDLTLAQDLADRAALALTNARLYQQVQVAQQAAAEALARLDALICSVPNGIGYLDRELRYQLVNPALAAINHCTPEEHLGRTPQEILPGLAPRLVSMMREVLATGEAVRDLELHGQLYAAIGGPHDWLISYFPVRDPAGVVTGVGVSVTDITVSKRTAAALQDLERKLGTLFELLPVGISIIDAAGTIAYVNPAAERIMRMDRARLLAGEHLAYAYRQADGTPLPLADHTAIRARLAHQAVSGLELGFTTEAGEEVWTSIHTVPVDFPDWRVVMVTTDITAQKVVEAHLRASEERHAFLLWLSDRLHPLNDPEAIQFEAACALGEHLGVSRVGYAEDQADDETIVVTRHYTNGVPGIEGRYRYDDYGPELLRAFRAGHAVVRPDIANDPTLTDAEKAAHAALQLGATVNVPLLKAGRLIAVLFMHHHTARAWSPQELTLLEDVAARTWDAVERARAEAIVRQQAAMLDHAHILIRDAEHRIVFWNQGATRLYGWTADEALGRISHDLFQTRFPTSLEEVQAQLFATGRWEGELVHHRRDGEEVVVASLQLLFRDEAGRTTHILEVNNDVTALKRAEEELHAREEQLRLSLDAAELGVWHLDDASGMMTLDARARAHFGVTDERLPFATLATRVHPEDCARVQREAQELRRIQHEGQAHTEYRVVHPDGSMHWLAVHVRYRFSGVGAGRAIVGGYGTTQEITARKAREAMLQAAFAELETHVARLNSLLAHAPVGISLLDTALRFQQINPTLAAMNGLSPEAHLGRPIGEVLPALATVLEPIYLQVLATGEPLLDQEISGESPATPGEQRAWRVSYFPVLSMTAGILGVGAVVLDVTAQRQAEQARDAAYRQLEAIVEALDEGVIAVQSDGAVVVMNRSARERMLTDPGARPRTVRELSAMSAMALSDATGQPLATDALPFIRVLRGESFRNWELRMRPALAAEERWVLISGVQVPAEEGVAALSIMTRTDITEIKRAELTVAAHAETLSRTNAELTRALKLKDEFLAMMSHELRTPLNVVLGMSEALDEELYGPITDRQRQILARVTRSGRHLLAILSDILDLAHLEAGKHTLELQRIDVDSLCRTALQFVQSAAQSQGVQVVRTVEIGIEGLRANERRLTQILTNLLDNAVKFTPQGGRVGLEVMADTAQERITFTVWDTGIGIAREDLDRLFQPFTQVDGRLARAYEGIGLGLTLVRRLVEMHGGSISLESTPGQGSRFTVSLPWSPEENVAPPTLREPAPRSRTWTTPPRLVIADDHELTLQFYGELLRERGCEVVLARTGAEAVAQVRATRPEVAIIDVQMPELDGLSAIRQIRANPETGALPIIALTALAMPGDRERCLAAGANVYLAKPVGIRTLIAAIAEALALTSTNPT